MRRAGLAARLFPAAAALLALAVLSSAIGVRAQGTDTLTFLYRIGTPSFSGTLAPGEFVTPLGLAVDSTGMIIVTDTEWYTPEILSNRVQVLHPNGTPAMPVLTGAGALGAFSYPTGAAVDAEDKVVIVDSMNSRILIMDSVADGMTLLHEFGSFGNYDPFWDGEPGPAPLDEFFFPTAVALKPGTRLLDPTDLDGRIVIVDNSNHRFVLLNSMLNLATGISIGLDTSDPGSVNTNPPGMFEYPWAAAVDDAGRIYVTDTYNHRVQAFSPTGVPLWQFGSMGPTNSPSELLEPSNIIVDADGRLLFVSDRMRSRILRVDLESDLLPSTPLPSCAQTATVGHADRCRISRSDGRILEALVIGSFGSADGELLSPYGIARTPSNHLLIADTGKHVLQAFGVADLQILQVTASGPGIAGGTHELEVTVTNIGTASLTTSVAVTGLSLAGQLSPAAPQTLEPNETAAFHLGFVPAASGTLTFNARATGVDARGGTVTTALSAAEPVEISPPPTPLLTAAIAASPGLVGVGGSVNVTVTLINGGGTTFPEFTPEVTPAGSAVVAPAGSSFDLSPLGPGESRELTFTFTAQGPGSVSFGAAIEAASEDPLEPGVFVPYPTVTASSNAVTVQLDVTPPVATATLTSAEAPQNDWYRTPVTVTLSAEDAGTGVRALHFTVAGSIKFSRTVLGSSASFVVTQTGVTSFDYRAEDNAGNLSAWASGQVMLDSNAPTINNVTLVPPPNAFGWNNTDVEARFFAGDTHSGLAFVTPQEQTRVTTEGANQVIHGIARDLAGNEVTRDEIVHVDKTPPSLTCVADRDPDHNGWYQSAVTVTCTATDQPGLSGVAYVTPPQTLTADGIHTFLGEALDRAGNLATVTHTIKVDQTPPVMMACRTLSGGETWPPNHKLNPWTVTVTPTDPVSGVASLTLVAYWSNEPDNGKSDGHFVNDMQGWVLGTPDLSGFIRAERAGSKGGRTYTLRYEALDHAGNVESCEITTGVPHDQGKGKN
jgi:hypothetical protein